MESEEGAKLGTHHGRMIHLLYELRTAEEDATLGAMKESDGGKKGGKKKVGSSWGERKKNEESGNTDCRVIAPIPNPYQG